SIGDGASVSTAGTAWIGRDTTGDGSVTVSGANSSWSVGLLSVGNAGKGELAIENGATTSSAGDIYVGNVTGGDGSVSVTGAGSALWSDANLYVGGNYLEEAGSGSVVVSDGAALQIANRIK